MILITIINTDYKNLDINFRYQTHFLLKYTVTTVMQAFIVRAKKSFLRVSNQTCRYNDKL